MPDPSALAFDSRRVARLDADSAADISVGRCHGAALAVRRHADVMLTAPVE